METHINYLVWCPDVPGNSINRFLIGDSDEAMEGAMLKPPETPCPVLIQQACMVKRLFGR